MRDRVYAERNGYDLFAYHLLCAAMASRQHYTESGLDCFVFSETYTSKQFNVYYMAHKRVRPLTPEERYE